MAHRRISVIGWLFLIGILALAGYGCSGGGDTDGGDENFEGTGFVATDDAAGGLTLTVDQTTLSISEVSGFSVDVFDASGDPVAGLEIACDTEQGLAIVEPNTGFELTDSSGHMSGKVGCESPGSYQMACRLPIGGNKRKFETIRCSGDIPTGFSGFPGAAGGTLGVGTGGGGSADQGDGGAGGTDEGGVRVSAVNASDGGNDDTLFIDTVAEVCDRVDQNGDDDTDDVCDIDPEAITDTVVSIEITNNTNQTVSFSSFSYTVPNADGQGGSFTSDNLALSVSGEAAPNGGKTTLVGLFVKATNDTSNVVGVCGYANRKQFTGADFLVPTSLGFRSVTIRLNGVNSLGDAVSITSRVGLSFDAYGNCG